MIEARATFPNKLQAFGIVVALIVIEMLVVLVMRDFSLTSMMDRSGASAFITVAGNGFVFVFLTTYKQLSYRSLFHSASNSVAATLVTLFLPILLIVPGLVLLVGAINLLLTSMFPMSATEMEMFGSMMEIGVIPTLFTCIVAPTLEEMLFRGIILRSFLNQYSRATSILWSASLFGLAHLNIYQFFTALIMGIVLGWLYERTRSLWPSILLHGSFNAYSVLLANEDRPGAPDEPDLWILGVEIGCAIVGGFLLRRMLQPNDVVSRKLDRDSQ